MVTPQLILANISDFFSKTFAHEKKCSFEITWLHMTKWLVMHLYINKEIVLLIMILNGQHENIMHDLRQFMVHHMIIRVQYTWRWRCSSANDCKDAHAYECFHSAQNYMIVFFLQERERWTRIFLAYLQLDRWVVKMLMIYGKLLVRTMKAQKMLQMKDIMFSLTNLIALSNLIMKMPKLCTHGWIFLWMRLIL